MSGERASLIGWLGIGALMAAAGALILYEGRGLTFYNDEWFFVLYRDGRDVGNFLAGHGDHIVVLPVVMFLGLFKAVGLDSYEAYRLLALPGHLACGAAIYLIARRRIGPVAALAPAAVLLFLGSSWDDLLRPFQISFTGAIAGGLLALLLLEQGRLRDDLLACAALVVGLGFSGAVLPFVAAAGAGLLLQRRLLRRLWIPVVPAVLYLLWARKYSDQDVDYAANLDDVPGYALDLAGAAAAGLTGLPQGVGVALVLVLAVITLLHMRATGLSPLVLQGAAIGLSFWGLTAITQAHEGEPLAVRYVYIGVVALLLILIGIAPRQPWSRGLTLGILIAAVAVLPSNIDKLLDGGRYLRERSAVSAAELGAVEIAKDRVDPAYEPPLADFAGVPVPAGFYLGSVGRYASSPADTPAEIQARSPAVRRKADLVLAEALDLAFRPGPRQRPRCAEAEGILELEPGGHVLRAPPGSEIRVGLRRFADTFAIEVGSPPSRSALELWIPRDAAPGVPWHARARSASGLKICRVAAPGATAA
jgi:hypothetical protein